MHAGPTGRRMPTHREIRHCRAPLPGPKSPWLTGAIALAALPLAGCVDLLGDYHTSGCAQADCSMWAERFGDDDEQYAAGVAITDDDQIVILSNASGTIDFGAGPIKSAGSNDIFVTRLDAGGAHLWTTHFRGTGADYGNAIALDPAGNILVAGAFESVLDLGGKKLTSAGDKDLFVAKLSPDGDVLWANRYGDLYGQTAAGIASDSTGAVLVTGCFAGDVTVGATVLQSPASNDAFVMKLGPDGSPRWAFAAGDAASLDCGFRVAADASDNVLVTGGFGGSVIFEQAHFSAGKTDIFLAKLDPDGQPIWSHRYGGLEDDFPGGLLVAPSGRIVLAGSYQGAVDFGGSLLLTAKYGFDPFVLSIDSTGSTVWNRGLGGGEQEHLLAATLDREGNILVAGTSGPDPNNVDAYAAKIGQKGEVLWSHIWEASDSQEATGIAVDGSDDTVLVGRVAGTLQISGFTLESAGAHDVLVAKLGTADSPPE